MKLLALTVSLAAMVAISGCATKVSETPAGPPGYQEGFAAGCDSGYVAAGHPYYRFRKDPSRFAADEMYRQGWNDGFATCKGKYDAIGNSMRR